MATFPPPTTATLALRVKATAGAQTAKSVMPQRSSDWLVLVYQAADNNLDPYAMLDLKEMQKVGSSDKLKIVALTDREGAVIVWESAGSAGFKGSRKSTPFAAQVTADSAARKGMEHGLQKVEVFVKGPGSGRETAIRSLQAAGLEILSVKDVTPQAHNGVRQKKRRRV